MKRESGFTLLELMVTVGIAAILLSVGVPSFKGMIMDSRLARDSNQFVASISMARSAAVKYQRNATVCASTDYSAPVPTCSASQDWSNGWIVWVDKDRDGATDGNEIISVQAPIDGTTTFSASAVSRFSYDARGFGATPSDDLTMCDNRSGETGRVIKVNNVGRTHVARQGCS